MSAQTAAQPLRRQGAAFSAAVGGGRRAAPTPLRRDPRRRRRRRRALVDDYEITGDATSACSRSKSACPSCSGDRRGRAGHREWVQRCSPRPSLTAELLVATDVHAWKLLRRDQGLSRDETVADDRAVMVEAVLPAPDRHDPHPEAHDDHVPALPVRHHRRRRHRARRHLGHPRARAPRPRRARPRRPRPRAATSRRPAPSTSSGRRPPAPRPRAPGRGRPRLGGTTPFRRSPRPATG